jgi:hypothetical protein
MGAKSRRKGATGEREFAEVLRGFNITARRSQQFCGLNQTADLTTSAKCLHFEVKRYQRIAALRFMDQAVRDAGERVPVVAMREDRGQWHVMIRAEDLVRFATEIVASTQTPNGISD